MKYDQAFLFSVYRLCFVYFPRLQKRYEYQENKKSSTATPDKLIKYKHNLNHITYRKLQKKFIGQIYSNVFVFTQCT